MGLLAAPCLDKRSLHTYKPTLNRMEAGPLNIPQNTLQRQTSRNFMLRQFGFVRAKWGKATHYGALGLVMVEEQ